MYMTTRKIEGISYAQLNSNLQYNAPVNDNPNEAWYWNVCVQSADQATTAAVVAYCQIKFYCQFEARKLMQDA